MHVMAARNEKRIGDLDKSSDGLFIFIHFVAADPDVLLELFEYRGRRGRNGTRQFDAVRSA